MAFHQDAGGFVGARERTLIEEVQFRSRRTNLFIRRKRVIHRVIEHESIIGLGSVDQRACFRIIYVILEIIHPASSGHRGDRTHTGFVHDGPLDVFQVIIRQTVDGQFDFGEITDQHQVFEQVSRIFTRDKITFVVGLHDAVVVKLGQDAVRHEDAGPVGAHGRFGPHRSHDRILVHVFASDHERNAFGTVGDDVHTRCALIHRKKDLEIIGIAVCSGKGGHRLAVLVHGLRHGISLRVSGCTENRHVDVLDTGRVGEITKRTRIGLEHRDFRLHRDGHEPGGLDVLLDLDGFILGLGAGNQAKQER